MHDTRNVIDIYKHVPQEDIIADLDAKDHGLHIAVENTERDFNMGTIVRNANAFGIRYVHVIGRRQWNKRGAMMTDTYLHVIYHASTEDFLAHMREDDRTVVAIDNVPGSVNLADTDLPRRCVLVFGQEGPGISPLLIEHASRIVAIEQFGSTRSVNVGVASGIAMYAWLQQHVLQS